MPNCEQCGESFPNHIIVDGKRRNLQNRHYCLDCSPFGLHNTSKLEGGSRRGRANSNGLERRCVLCGRPYVFRNGSGHTLTRCNSCAVYQRRTETKRRAVEYLGGACKYCGYSKCLAALTFNHRDSTKKDFNIGRVGTKPWKVVVLELDKCDLVCFNCHTEFHWGMSGDRRFGLKYTK